MDPLNVLSKNLNEIEEKIGYKFKDRSTLQMVFIHRSYINEAKTIVSHNERLEFLGDSVLGLLISEYLYRQLPDTSEGELSFLRSRLVEASSCVFYIQQLSLEKYMILGKGERMNDGRGRDTILADLFEALIGAIYLDGGLESAKKFLFAHFLPQIGDILKTPVKNWKAELQDFSQRKYHQMPIYKLLGESGPDHSKTFKISVIVNDIEMGSGEGTSKKEAQQAAAKDAIKNISAQGTSL